VLSGNLSAQVVSIDGWPNWDASAGGPQRRPIIVFEDRPPEFGGPLAPPARRPASFIVTLHELSHRIPARAKRDFERALKASTKRDDETAITYLKKALEADPEFCAAWNNLGVAYLRLGRTELAIEQFTRAIEVDPYSAKPRLNLAGAYIQQHLFADGERAARRGIDLDHEDPYGPLSLGVALVLEGKFTAEAERNLVKASETYVVAKLWLGVGLAGRGDIANAKEQIRKYITATHAHGSNLAIRFLAELEGNSPDAQ